jgi:plasmid stabilization system protein ParE
MYSVLLKPGAEADTKKAYEWYENIREGLGGEFLNELEKLYRQLELNPHVFGNEKNKIRQVVLKRFPYVLFYEIEESSAVVYGILHKRRHPKLRNFKK